MLKVRLLFFVFVLVNSVGCGAPNLELHQEIADRIERLNGRVDELSLALLERYGFPIAYRGAICGIYLNHIDVEGVDFESIVPEDSLVTVYCRGSTINDEQVRAFADCDRLEILNLESSLITDDALASIAKIKSLKQLWISRCNITDKGIIALQDHPSLEDLHIVDTHITAEGVARLKEKLPDLHVNHVTVLSKKVRKALAELERRGANVTGASKAIRDKYPGTARFMVSLIETELSPWRDGPPVTELLKTITGAGDTRLHFGGGSVPEDFASLGELESIYELRFTRDAAITDAYLGEINGIGYIGTLKMDATLVTAAGLRHLAAIEILKKLTLVHLATDDVAALAECGTLKELTFSSCDLQNSSLDALAACKSLQKLTLDRCENLRPQAIESLQKKRPMLIIEKH